MSSNDQDPDKPAAEPAEEAPQATDSAPVASDGDVAETASGEPSAGADRPPPTSPPPPNLHIRKRPVGWGRRLLALILLLLVAGAGALYVCARDGVAPPSIAGTQTDQANVNNACQLGDCYVSLTIDQERAASGKDAVGGDGFCCRYVTEPRPVGSGTLSVTLNGEMIALTAQSAIAPLGTAAVAPTRWRRVPRDAEIAISLRARAVAERTLPLLDAAVARGWLAPESAGWLEQAHTALVDRLFPATDQLTESRINLPITAAGGTAIVDFGDGRPITLTATPSVRGSILFEPEVARFGSGPRLLRQLVGRSPPSIADLGDRIRGLSDRADLGEAEDWNADSLVARAEALADSPAEDFAEACGALYRAGREHMSRLDAAVLTYLAAHRSPHFAIDGGAAKHPCVERTPDLGAVWAALGAEFPIRQTSTPREIPQPSPAPMATATEAEAETPPSALELAAIFTGNLTVGAKQARISDPDLLKHFPERLSVQVGAMNARLPRDQVLRLLAAEWSHAGCWTVLPALGGHVASLLVEAQFPYLNMIRISLTADGQVRGLSVRGVTHAELVVERRLNRGTGCRRFLNVDRLAAYRDWLAPAGPTARTPTDHAAALLRTGGAARSPLVPIR